MLHIPQVFIKMTKTNMQFTGSAVPACSFCLNRYRSQLDSTNVRAEGLNSDPVQCEYFGQMVETLSPDWDNVCPICVFQWLISLYSFTHSTKAWHTQLLPRFLPQFAVCRSWHNVSKYWTDTGQSVDRFHRNGGHR